MKKVFKYRIPYQSNVSLQLPRGSKIIYFDVQNGLPYLWALVDQDTVEDPETRNFIMVFTGYAIEETRPLEHIGSCQNKGDAWHLFEVIG